MRQKCVLKKYYPNGKAIGIKYGLNIDNRYRKKCMDVISTELTEVLKQVSERRNLKH